jgi:hypothetical protein
MTKEQKEIYLNIRAEQIKYFQDTRNGHLFNTPYSLEHARIVAEQQLQIDLSRGMLRISLDELLMNDNEACLEIAHERQIEIVKKLDNTRHHNR